jgi:hypothetical protein
MTWVGPVARIREAMEQERAAAALAAQLKRASPDGCPIAARVLREKLLTAPDPDWYGLLKVEWKPWRLGTDMRGPTWMWQGVARVVNDNEHKGVAQVWTRKAHRAWRKETYALSTIAAAILRGEIRDPW